MEADLVLVNDLDHFVGAFEEFICIVGEQLKDQPVMKLDSIGLLLFKQLNDINRRVQELNKATSDLPWRPAVDY